MNGLIIWFPELWTVIYHTSTTHCLAADKWRVGQQEQDLLFSCDELHLLWVKCERNMLKRSPHSFVQHLVINGNITQWQPFFLSLSRNVLRITHEAHVTLIQTATSEFRIGKFLFPFSFLSSQLVIFFFWNNLVSFICLLLSLINNKCSVI
jgi:hypothetical protein